MKDPIFHHTAVALAAGMVAQTIAARLAIPSIVPLLAAGALLGPDLLGVLDPAVFRAGRSDLVNLAVTVILFEGGLALDLTRLRHQQRSIVLLLTVGGLVSMVAATAAAHTLVGLPMEIAILYGALMIVTGPTVVTPLLSRLTLDRKVREMLVSEGVLIDPIGAIVAIVAAEAVVGHHDVFASPLLVLQPLAIGGLAGAVAGVLMTAILRRHWIPDDLESPVVLGVVLLVAALSSGASADAGLMAAVVLGVVLGNARLPQLQRLREFKEALTVILLSFIFVVLAADLRLSSVVDLGWPGLWVVAIVAWVARPVSVGLSTWGSDFTLRQRAFMSWICPRGIVAAAVAGFFRDLLDDAGVAGGRELEALVFLTVACTVALQGLTAGRVAHVLGVDVPKMIGTIVVGADHFGRLLTRLLLALGRQAVVIDRSSFACRAARKDGLPVYEGDALSEEVLEEAGARYADTLIAVTRNVELNELLVQRVHAMFPIQRIIGLDSKHAGGEAASEEMIFPGQFPGIEEVNQLLRFDRARVVEYEFADGELIGSKLMQLPWGEAEFAILVRRGESTFVAAGHVTLAKGDRVWCLRPTKGTSGLEQHATVTEFSLKTIRTDGIGDQREP